MRNGGLALSKGRLSHSASRGPDKARMTCSIRPLDGLDDRNPRISLRLPWIRRFPSVVRPRNFDSATVVDGAMREFWRNGFNATAVERLCAVMELSPGSLYGAFGGKRELFIAALDRYMDQ